MNLLFYQRGSSNVSSTNSTTKESTSTTFVDNETSLFDLLCNYHFHQTKKLIHDNDEGGDGKSNNKNEDDEEELLYYKIAILIEQTPNIVHSYNIDGYTPLQLICSNPLLASNIQLIKLLIDTSAQLEWECDNPNVSTNTNKKAVTVVGNKHHYEYRNSKNIKSTTSMLIPTPAKVIYQKSKNLDEQMILHISCLNAFYTTIDIIDYIIHCHPSAVCHTNKRNGNLPIHNACVATTVSIVPIEFIILLVQQWPESLHEMNYDGNLPLHLVCHIYFHSKTTNTNTSTTTTTTTTTTNSNNNKNGVNKLSIMNHRYEYQLQIIQYIVDYYPDAIFIKNKNNETPSQIAYNSSHSFYDIDDIDDDQYDPTLKQRKRDLHPIVSFLYEFEKHILKQKEEQEIKQKQQQADDIIVVTQPIDNNNNNMNTTNPSTTFIKTVKKDNDFTLDENGRKTRVIKRGIVAKKSGDIAEGIISNPWQQTTRLGRKKSSDDPLGAALKILTDDNFTSIPKNSKKNSNHNNDLINDNEDDSSDDDNNDDNNTTTSDDDASVAKYLKECLVSELIEKNIVIPTTTTTIITPLATATTNTIITTTESANNVLIGGDDSQKSFHNTGSDNNISVYDDSNTSNNHESIVESMIGADYYIEDDYSTHNTKMSKNTGLQSYIERMSMSKTIRLDEFRQSIDDLDTLIQDDDEENDNDEHQQQEEKEHEFNKNKNKNDLLVYPTLRKKQSIRKMSVMNDYSDDIMNGKISKNTTSNGDVNNQQQQQQNEASTTSKEQHKNILQKSHEKMKQLLHSNKISPPNSPKNNNSPKNSPKSSRTNRKVVDNNNNKMINFFPTRDKQQIDKKKNMNSRSLSTGRSRLHNADRSLSTGRSRLNNADDFLEGIREARRSTKKIGNGSNSNRDVVDDFFPTRDTPYSMNDIIKKNKMSQSLSTGMNFDADESTSLRNADDFVKSIREARLEASLSPEVIPKKSIVNLQSLNKEEFDGNNSNDSRRLSSSSEHNNHHRLSSSSEHYKKNPVISENRIFLGSSERGRRSTDVYIPPSINLLSDDDQIPLSSLHFEYEQRLMNDNIIDDTITPLVNNRRKIKVDDQELPESLDIMQKNTSTDNNNYYTKTKKIDHYIDEQRKSSQTRTDHHEDVSGNNNPDYNYYDEFYDDDTNTTYSHDDESTTDNNNNNNDKRRDDHNDEKRKKRAYRRRIKKLVKDPTSENLEI